MLRDLFSLFPAYAGVILENGKNTCQTQPFPRIRGGDPKHSRLYGSANELFPAYAGVIPVLCPGLIFFPAFPRIRGGDPMFNPKKVYSGRFSPHTRG